MKAQAQSLFGDSNVHCLGQEFITWVKKNRIHYPSSQYSLLGSDSLTWVRTITFKPYDVTVLFEISNYSRLRFCHELDIVHDRYHQSWEFMGHNFSNTTFTPKVELS